MPLNDYGKRVKHALIDREQTVTWLAKEVSKKTGLFVDTGYLNKIFTGKRNPTRVISGINEVLGFETKEVI